MSVEMRVSLSSRCLSGNTLIRILVYLDKLLLGNMASKGILAAGFWIQYLGAAGLGEICNVLEWWWLGYWASKYGQRSHGDVRATLYVLNSNGCRSDADTAAAAIWEYTL